MSHTVEVVCDCTTGFEIYWLPADLPWITSMFMAYEYLVVLSFVHLWCIIFSSLLRENYLWMFFME